MWNNLINSKGVIIVSSALMVSTLPIAGCSMLGKAPAFTPQLVKRSEPVRFQLSTEKGHIERVRLQSRSFTQTLEAGELVHEQTEIVDFLVESTAKKVQKNGDVTFEVTTLEKDGPVDLRDLAFPEEGEVIELVLRSNAKVLKAGEYPKTSIFFIPPVSFPENPVEVGDTWVLRHEWISLRSGIPMEVEVVSILKNFYECGVSETCAEIEISGAVKILGPLGAEMKLKSEIVGRLLLDVESGSIVWSDIRNLEELQSGQTTIKVRSCMESVLTDPVAKRWLWRNTPECDPMLPLSDTIPGL